MMKHQSAKVKTHPPYLRPHLPASRHIVETPHASCDTTLLTTAGAAETTGAAADTIGANGMIGNSLLAGMTKAGALDRAGDAANRWYLFRNAVTAAPSAVMVVLSKRPTRRRIFAGADGHSGAVYVGVGEEHMS